MASVPRPYPKEFREDAIRRVDAGQSVRTVAQTLGISDRTLRRWLDEDNEALLRQGRQLRQESEDLLEFLKVHPEALRKSPRRE